MQVSSVNKLLSKDINIKLQKENRQKRIIYVIGLMVIVFSALFLTAGVNPEHIDYAMRQRIPKLIAIVLIGGCIAFSSMIFQTITNNNILTPSVLGLDSLYILVQTLIVFIVGIDSKFIASKSHNFLLSVVIMVIAQNTGYVFLDEPLNNLDMKHSVEMMRVLRNLCDELGKTDEIINKEVL